VSRAAKHDKIILTVCFTQEVSCIIVNNRNIAHRIWFFWVIGPPYFNDYRVNFYSCYTSDPMTKGSSDIVSPSGTQDKDILNPFRVPVRKVIVEIGPLGFGE